MRPFRLDFFCFPQERGVPTPSRRGGRASISLLCARPDEPLWGERTSPRFFSVDTCGGSSGRSAPVYPKPHAGWEAKRWRKFTHPAFFRWIGGSTMMWINDPELDAPPSPKQGCCSLRCSSRW